MQFSRILRLQVKPKTKAWLPPVFDRNVVLYESGSMLQPRLLYVAAASVMTMWLSLSVLCWEHLEEYSGALLVKDGDHEKQPASAFNRTVTAGLCAAIGLIFPALAESYCRKKVRRLTVLKGGDRLRLETSQFGNSIRVYPIAQLQSSVRISSPFSANAGPVGPQVLLTAPSLFRSRFLIDGGTFTDKKLFDYLLTK